MTYVAKLFKNGRSQAVRLSAAYRFEGEEVFIRKDFETRDIILSKKPQDWHSFFVELQKLEVPSDFMDEK